MRFSRLFLLPIISFAVLFISVATLGVDVFFYVIAPFIGLAFIMVSWVPAYYWFKKLPPVFHTLYRSHKERRIPLLVVHDSGRGKIVLIEEALGEGVVKTEDGDYRIVPQYPNAPSPIRDAIARRTILEGLDLPFFVGYSGRLCLLNPETLALWETGENAQGQAKTDNPSSEKPLLLLDPRKIKDIIGTQFSVSQIGEIINDSEGIGMIRSLKTFGKLMKIAIPFAIIVMAVLAIILIMTFLKG